MIIFKKEIKNIAFKDVFYMWSLESEDSRAHELFSETTEVEEPTLKATSTKFIFMSYCSNNCAIFTHNTPVFFLFLW